jgi:hypothetical protein
MSLSTNTRRSILTGGIAALAVAPALAASHADAELLQLLAAIKSNDVFLNGYERTDDWTEFDVVSAENRRLFDRAMQIPALTKEGRRAKAELVLDLADDRSDANWIDRAAISLVRDLLTAP